MHAAQPYSDSITEVVADLAAVGGGIDSALLVPRPEVRNVAHIVIAADRGLCGAYNSNVLRAAEAAVAEDRAAGAATRSSPRGRKAEGYFRYRDYAIDAVVQRVLRLAHLRGRPRRRRRPRPGRSSPRRPTSSRSSTRASCRSASRWSSARRSCRWRATTPTPARRGAVHADYEFEPSPEGILDLLLPRYVESRVFAALLERGRVGARRPPAGDEVGHRQRRTTSSSASAAS